MYIDLQGLVQSPAPSSLLYEILKPYGFSNSIAAEILEERKQPSGRQFFSDTYRLVHDRQSLILQKTNNQTNPKIENRNDYLIDEEMLSMDVPIGLKIDKFDNYSDFLPDSSPETACLDGDKIQFPLLLRKWKSGDRFRPLGMKNMKKLSDFFIDAKLSLIEKENCWVMISGGQIAWIVGLRIDDRFKITGKTKKIVRFRHEK